MRGHVVMLAASLLGLAAPAGAQAQRGAASSRTAEEFVETARRAYAVEEPKAAACPEAANGEIVVCGKAVGLPDQRLQSPTERAYAAGERPPDPIPSAPYVLGLPECGVEVTCHRIGRAPPPIHIIDLAKIPEPLAPDEAALVIRAEDLSSSAEASPAAAP